MTGSGMAPGAVSRAGALACLCGGLAAVALVGWAGARGMEPVATWLYLFSWYPLLVALEGGVALRHGRFFLLGRPATALSVLAWSVPLWMLWELLNFRVENWYYVFVPDGRAALWTGVVTSFATVLPACFLPAALFLPRRDAEQGAPGRIPAASARSRLALGVSGALMLLLPLLWPRLFFPLIWGGFFLLAERDTHQRAPARSLVTDLLRGRLERLGALLAGGALAGLAWEGLNAHARGRWIYTVPWLEETKLFEMPPLGFLGFPVLAISCFALYQWLVSRGWARPVDLYDLREESGSAEAGDVARRAGARWASAGAVLLVVGVLLGMERWTISSRTPRIRDLPGLLPGQVETLRAWGVSSPFDLSEMTPGALVRRAPTVEARDAEGWIATARLATTRGIGARNARLLHRWGVTSLSELAATDTAALSRCFREAGEDRVRPAQVRVWWRAARRRAGVVEGPAEAPSC